MWGSSSEQMAETTAQQHSRLGSQLVSTSYTEQLVRFVFRSKPPVQLADHGKHHMPACDLACQRLPSGLHRDKHNTTQQHTP